MRRLVIALALSAASAASAQDVDFSGSIAAEIVQFPKAGLAASQSGKTQASLSFDAELRWFSEDGSIRVQVLTFGRLDELDDNRSHFDVREAYVAYNADRFEILAGVNKLFWGVTESRHLVDIINQADQLEFTNREARLGQPMVMASYQFDSGRLSAIVMSGFREMAFPGPSGRFGFGLPVDEAAATFEAADGTSAIDAALRYSAILGSVDLGLSAFRGTSREPTLAPNGGGTALVPNYARISQIGVDAQYTGDVVLLKFEGIRRSGQGATFSAAVAGIEYTFFQFAGGNGDLGVIAEYLYDGRDATAPPTLLDDDIFVGARWAANDTQDTSFLFGATVDLNDRTTAVRAEFTRRIGESYTLSIEAQAIVNADPANPAYGFRQDDYVLVGFSYNF